MLGSWFSVSHLNFLFHCCKECIKIKMTFCCLKWDCVQYLLVVRMIFTCSKTTQTSKMGYLYCATSVSDIYYWEMEWQLKYRRLWHAKSNAWAGLLIKHWLKQGQSVHGGKLNRKTFSKGRIQ